MNINGKWYTETELQAYVNKLLAKIDELEAKHHNECGQIAHYDDELREYTMEHTERVWVMKSDVLDLITEAYKDGRFKDYSDYDSLWDAVDDMPGKRGNANDN